MRGIGSNVVAAIDLERGEQDGEFQQIEGRQEPGVGGERVPQRAGALSPAGAAGRGDR